jgi:hypothetical protein
MVASYYLGFKIYAKQIYCGWRVSVVDATSRSRHPLIHRSNLAYPSQVAAITAGRDFVQRSIALFALLDFLCDCHHSGRIQEVEFDDLTTSLFMLCVVREPTVVGGYWYCADE